jgi:rhomboid protease GluP
MANCSLCGRKLPPFTFGKTICQWCVQHQAAQRGELPDDAPQPVMAAPWVRRQSSGSVTKVFFGINVAVFVGMLIAGVSIMDPTGEQLVHWGANFGPYTLSGQWWRLLTSVFLHIGIIHIAFNMWCLWDLGALCESLYGSWTFGVVYLICGIAGSVASVGWRPTGLSAGASGAIFGIAGALIASYYLGEFSMPRFAIAGQLRSLLLFAGYNLLFGAVSGRTDNAAHIGGLVSGLIMGALVARIAPQETDLARRFGILALVATIVLGAFIGLEYWRGYPMLVGRGGDYLAQKQADQAMRLFRLAIRIKPDAAPAHLGLGMSLAAQKNYEAALREYAVAARIAPNTSSLNYEMGITYFALKRYDEAVTSFQKELQATGEDSDVEAALADAYHALGLTKEAAEARQKAEQLGNNSK